MNLSIRSLGYFGPFPPRTVHDRTKNCNKKKKPSKIERFVISLPPEKSLWWFKIPKQHISPEAGATEIMYIGANLGGHLVWLLPAKCSHLVMKSAWPVWGMRNYASSAYINLPTQSISCGGSICSVPGRIVGLIATTHHYIGRRLKSCCCKRTEKLLLVLTPLWWLLITCALVTQCYSSFLLSFTSLNDFIKRIAAYEQEEAAGKQFPLASAGTPAGESRSFIRTLWFA